MKYNCVIIICLFDLGIISQLVNTKIQYLLNLLYSRRAAKRMPCVLQVCAEECVFDHTPLSDKSDCSVIIKL